MSRYHLAMRVVLLSLLSACPSDGPPSPTDTLADPIADVGPALDVGASDSLRASDPGPATDVGPSDAADAGAPLDTDRTDGPHSVEAFNDAEERDGAADAELSPDLSDASDVTDAPGETPTVWGPIVGEACGSLQAAFGSPEPSFHVTTWSIEVATFDPSLLEPGPKKRFDAPNAGGSSKCSEVMSLSWLIACEGAELYKTETEIIYDTAGAITDYAASIGTDRIGVSVTRAYLGPFNTNYTSDNAITLLSDKLAGVNASTDNVTAADAWQKQILHVWTLQADWVPILQTAWEQLDSTLKADTIVLVTVEEGSDFIVTDSCDD